MAQANETNNSVYTETKSLSEIQSAQEFIHLNSDQTQGFQHSVIKEEIDPDHPTNLNSVESHIPSQAVSHDIVKLIGETPKSWLDKPIAIQTGNLTLKISKSIVSSHCHLEQKNSSAKQKTKYGKKKKKGMEVRPDVVTIYKPSDKCSVCHEDFEISNSVYCLVTGDVRIICTRCATMTCMRGALKVSKNLQS